MQRPWLKLSWLEAPFQLTSAGHMAPPRHWLSIRAQQPCVSTAFLEMTLPQAPAASWHLRLLSLEQALGSGSSDLCGEQDCPTPCPGGILTLQHPLEPTRRTDWLTG